MNELQVTDARKAVQALNENSIWANEIDDFTIEVIIQDKNTALDILADEFLLQDLVDFAKEK